MRSSCYPLVLFAFLCQSVRADERFDVVIYGSGPAAITAAIEVGRAGKKAVVVSPESRIGGLTTGGLGQTDIGNKDAFGGLALQFYRDISRYYRDERHWKWQRRSEYICDEKERADDAISGSMWTFEPSAALAILEGWERDYRLDIRRGERLDRSQGGMRKRSGRIESFRTLSGTVYRGNVFVDATYEGDLMAAAGVPYSVGRESNAVYGETLNGCQVAHAEYHQFMPRVSAYVRPGEPESGLLPGIEPLRDVCDGDGDRRVQAYCFRMCLTDDPRNRIPFSKPEGYDERDYELLFRNYECGAEKEGLPWINSRMPNRKTDTNNRTAFSTDFIGANWSWPEASYEERERILAEHLRYQRGLMWTLANHPRIPAGVRQEVSRWGTCRDEFQDGLGDGWQRQLYVREARRMVGEYVVTEHDCVGRRIAVRPVAMAAYAMDSHHVRRTVDSHGFVRNEGDVEIGVAKCYPLDYGAIVPKRSDCENLIVPVCISASHIAYGSIRMEPVFFALGQAAGAAAVQAVVAGCAVQDVSYELLRKRLCASGQVIEVESSKPADDAIGRSR